MSHKESRLIYHCSHIINARSWLLISFLNRGARYIYINVSCAIWKFVAWIMMSFPIVKQMFQPLIENLYRSLEWRTRSVIRLLQFCSILPFLVSQLLRSQNLTIFQVTAVSVYIGQIISRNTLTYSLLSTNNGSQFYSMIIFSCQNYNFTIYYRLCLWISFLSNRFAGGNFLNVNRSEFFRMIIYPINDNMVIHWRFDAVWRHSHWDI